MKSRTVLYGFIALAPLAWAAFVVFTHFIPPQSILAFVAFFVILEVALTCTFTPIAYAVGQRFLASHLYIITIRYALRQGALFSLCIVLNLLLRALHSWNIFTGIVIVGAAVIIEILSLARK